MFAIGAVPTTALTFADSHDLTALAGAAIVGGIGFRPLVNVLDGKSLPTLPLVRKEVDVAPTIGARRQHAGYFGLWIGEATGTLSALGHTAGWWLQRLFNLPDAAKNIAIFGETGTGKTTRVINHLLIQALDFIFLQSGPETAGSVFDG